ncbi:IS66 family insertion sequence element accessory protein TnpB [Burkholderia ubonensis]|uniref:IS66 family insertion sequence element accessory protein TnpB n=1 Tax=Burkholderia ubonensis TaxID=101571 RepID=UPI0007C6C701
MLPAGTCIWLAAGVTDMRCGLRRLAAKVQTAPKEYPPGGNVYIFRGRRGDLSKILWVTDDGSVVRYQADESHYGFADILVHLVLTLFLLPIDTLKKVRMCSPVPGN